MPADFQCPVLAAKCDCGARGDGGRGRDGAREASGLTGKEAKADRREGKRGPGGLFGSVRGHQPHQDLERRGGGGGFPMSRREGLMLAGNRPAGLLRLRQARAQLAPGTSGSPVPRSHSANSSMDLAGGGAWALPDPAVNDSWGWTPATRASLPVGQVPLPAPVAGGTTHP